MRRPVGLAMAALTVAAVLGAGAPTAPAGAAHATWHPYSSAPNFVDDMYERLLGRAPTTAERTSWISRLEAGTVNAPQMVEVLLRSEEAEATQLAIRLYLTIVRKGAPDLDGLRYWTNRLRRDTSSAGTLRTILAFNSSVANTYVPLTTRHGNVGKTFVVNSFYWVVGGYMDDAGARYWTNAIDTGRVTRAGYILFLYRCSQAKRNWSVWTRSMQPLIEFTGSSDFDNAEYLDARDMLLAGESHKKVIRMLLDSPRFVGAY